LVTSNQQPRLLKFQCSKLNFPTHLGKKAADALKQKTDGLFTQATKEDLSPKISIISQSTLHLQRKLGLF